MPMIPSQEHTSLLLSHRRSFTAIQLYAGILPRKSYSHFRFDNGKLSLLPCSGYPIVNYRRNGEKQLINEFVGATKSGSKNSRYCG
jgi:hypothetical protein